MLENLPKMLLGISPIMLDYANSNFTAVSYLYSHN